MEIRSTSLLFFGCELSYNAFRRVGKSASIAALTRSLVANTSLLQLDLGGRCFDMPMLRMMIGINMTNAQLENFNEVLVTNTSLLSLNLSDNRLGDSAIESLIPVLKKNSNLQFLDVSNNNFHDKVSFVLQPQRHILPRAQKR